MKILDERAKDRSVNDPANYGRIEAIVEDEVSKVCSAQGIQLDKKLRKKCDDMLERFEDVLVRAWYDRSVQDDDWNMNWRICAKKHGLLKVCPVEIARLDVPQLDHLEQEVKLEELRSPVREGDDGRKRVKVPDAGGAGEARESRQRRDARAQRQRLSRAVIAEHGADTDALVYFAFANAHPEDAQGVMRTLKRAALAFRDENVKGEFIFTVWAISMTWFFLTGKHHAWPSSTAKRDSPPVRQPRQGSHADAVPGPGINAEDVALAGGVGGRDDERGGARRRRARAVEQAGR